MRTPQPLRRKTGVSGKNPASQWTQRAFTRAVAQQNMRVRALHLAWRCFSPGYASVQRLFARKQVYAALPVRIAVAAGRAAQRPAIRKERREIAKLLARGHHCRVTFVQNSPSPMHSASASGALPATSAGKNTRVPPSAASQAKGRPSATRRTPDARMGTSKVCGRHSPSGRQ